MENLMHHVFLFYGKRRFVLPTLKSFCSNWRKSRVRLLGVF